MPTSHTKTRRDFLIGSALGMAGIAASASAGCAGEQPPVRAAGSPRPLGIALLGLGDYASSQLAPALLKTKHCQLRGIVTGSPDKVDVWKAKYSIPDSGVYNYESLPRIADNPDIDVVYVVTPTALHAKYATMAAQAGKHVFCEKPMALTVDECQSMIAACQSNRVKLAIGYRLHHEPNTRAVMRLAKDKLYGKITSVRAVAGDRQSDEGTWRMKRAMGGGALYDMGVYSINAIRYATGEEPVRVVRARQWAERPELFRDVDENTEFELELPSGAIGHGWASRSDNTNVLRVEAANGWYKLEPMQAYTGVEGEASDGRKLHAKIDSQQARQMDDDALAILENRPLTAPGEEGLRDIRIVQAILESAQRNTPVPI